MNIYIICRINKLCEISATQQLAYPVRNQITCLTALTNEWLGYYLHPVNDIDAMTERQQIVSVLNDKITEKIINMVCAVADNTVSTDMLQIFSEIVTYFVDCRLASSKEFDILSNLFGNMDISNPSPNELAESISTMDIMDI